MSGKMSGLILLVEDNEQILRGNERMLKWSGYDVMTALTLREARERMASASPSAIVLDIMLPDGSGLDFMRELRQESSIPILILTGLTAPEDVVRGLADGGDDYLAKPYDFDVLLARIAALLRRAGRVPDTLAKGSIKIDITSRKAFLRGRDLLLKPKEFDVLLYLARNEGAYVAPETLYRKVWGQEMGGDDNAVKFQVSSLRKKLEGSGCAIASQRGEGYCFEKE
jgi:DNA-binding response OmpR family regulator